MKSGSEKWLWIILLFVIQISLSACIPTQIQPTPTAFTPVTTQQITHLPPTEPANPLHLSLDSEIFCNQNGKIERFQIDSKWLKEKIFFSVYIPPCYSNTKINGYPVLYAFHGQNFTDTMWIDLGAAEITDVLVRNNEIKPFLIVMPFEEYFFRDVEGNGFSEVVIEEVISWVENTFNVCVERSCRAIGGISRGASWAMRIGLIEWDYFGAIGAHSLPTFQGDIYELPEWLSEIPYGDEPRIYMDTGRFDPEVKTTYRFEQILNEKGIPHEWHLNDGRHNEIYWKENMEAYLRWYAIGWD